MRLLRAVEKIGAVRVRLLPEKGQQVPATRWRCGSRKSPALQDLEYTLKFINRLFTKTFTRLAAEYDPPEKFSIKCAFITVLLFAHKA